MAKTWLKLGGLYLNTGKNGSKYMVGYLGATKLFVFRNDEKRDEKDYDYHIMLTEREPKKAESAAAAPVQQETRIEDDPF